MSMIEFRRLNTQSTARCQCGKPMGFSWKVETQFRLKVGAKWGKWTNLSTQDIPTVMAKGLHSKDLRGGVRG